MIGGCGAHRSRGERGVPQRLIIGVGLRPGTGERAVRDLLDRVGAGLDLSDAVVATLDRRVDEPGLRAAVAPRVPRGYPAEALAAVDVPTPSTRVAGAIGTPGVAEAAALLAAGPGGELLVAKTTGDGVTAAVARCGVGLGSSGDPCAGRYPGPSPSQKGHR